MQRNHCFSLIISSIAMLFVLNQEVQARQDVVDFSDEPMEIQGTPESAERLANTIRIADNAILDYVTRSTGSIQQGHRQGFADFRDWYRAQRAEQARREATQAMLRGMVGTALGTSLNFVFPGSGTFMTVLREVSMAAYNVAADQIGSINDGDINMFLDRHNAVLEAVITDLLEVPETFRSRGGEELEAAKWEFIFEQMEREQAGQSPSSEVGPLTRRLLGNMGIPEPGAATATDYRIRILSRQIYAIFIEDQHLRISWSEPQIRTGANAAALRHIYPNEPGRYCPTETRLPNFFWSEPCRQWRNSTRP